MLADEQHMTAASPSDVATGFLLDAIPVPIWSEDFSAVAEWLATHVNRVRHTQTTLEDMRLAGTLDFATLSVALQEIRRLTTTV